MKTHPLIFFLAAVAAKTTTATVIRSFSPFAFNVRASKMKTSGIMILIILLIQFAKEGKKNVHIYIAFFGISHGLLLSKQIDLFENSDVSAIRCPSDLHYFVCDGGRNLFGCEALCDGVNSNSKAKTDVVILPIFFKNQYFF